MISIIIPTYNEEKAIEATITRLRSKLKVPYEIIVTDDKSLDNTVSIAKRFADIVLTPDEKHKTIAANRNAGAKVAKGDILIFLDCDVYIEDVSNILERFKDENIVALTGKLQVLPELETIGDKIVYFFFNLVHHIKNNILHSGEAPGKFQMIRRTAFDKVNGFREDLVTREDGDMFARLSKIGRTVYDPSFLVLHSGRRAHKIGWPKLLYIWMKESVYFAIFNKSNVKEWKDIR